jgi:hypothetical protein
MILPDRDEDLERRVKWLIDRCNETQRDRVQLYDMRERYFLFGTGALQSQVRYNRIESHLDLVTSFLYAPDNAFYAISAARNADDAEIRQAVALQDEFNDDFRETGTSDAVADAIPWALTYDTMLMKLGWSDVTGEQTVQLIPPHQFGVFREDLRELEEQEAFCHTFALEYHDAVMRLIRAGRETEIPRLVIINQPFTSPFPEMLTRMIIAGTGGQNLQGNIFGQINPDYTPSATYQPKTQHPMVMMDELWVWDDECEDYRIFHMCAPDILVGDSRKTVTAMMTSPDIKGRLEKRAGRVPKRRRGIARDGLLRIPDPDEKPEPGKVSPSNLFMPGESPFAKIQPIKKYNYFWGKAHIDALMSLQDWMNERFEQIDDLLERQAYPPRVGIGMTGLMDEKFEASSSADAWITEQMPNAKIEELAPKIPEDVFLELREIGAFFMEASGLTEVISGRGDQGVRSRGHAQQLQQTGSGRIKRTALQLESTLVRIGDIGLKLKMLNDSEKIVPEPADDPQGREVAEPFLAYQLASSYKMRISGHGFSPLFVNESRELALLLKRAGAIDNEMLTRMLQPPNMDAIIHAQKAAQRKERQLIMSLPPEQRLQLLAGGKGGGAGGKHK